jgi:stress-induced morphogen
MTYAMLISSLRLSKPALLRMPRLFASSDSMADTVVGRCTSKITSALNPSKISVTSTNDDPNGSHIQVSVVSTAFEGKRMMERQRMVYKAIWEELNGPVHAVDSIVAKTPAEDI